MGAAGVYAWGTYHRNSPLFGPVITRLPAARVARVALTFDDGPNPDATPRVLDALRAAGVRATFFVLGRHAAAWPELVRAIVADGHELGNHGWAHRKLTWASLARSRNDVRRGAEAIAAAAATGEPHWFRAPHGFRSPFVDVSVTEAGARLVGWSLGVFDSQRPGARTIADRVLAGVRSRSIVLLHDGDGDDPAGDRRQTAEALPEIVETLHRRGFAFVTLGEAITG